MRRAEVLISVLFLLLGIIVVADSVRVGFGWARNGPESGFFPFYLGAGLIVCAAFTLSGVVASRRKGEADKPLMPEGALKPVLWTVVPATLMVVLTEFVGLHIAAALYLAFYMRAVGKTGWVTTALVSLLVPISLYIAFDKFFLVPLPQGLWGAQLIPF
jgi:hypothetical protein